MRKRRNSCTGPVVPAHAVANLAVDVWRIARRINKDASTPIPVRLACDRALETLTEIGIEFRDYVNQQYCGEMSVHVVGFQHGATTGMITECLSPAVYYRTDVGGCAKLVRPAEVVVGRE